MPLCGFLSSARLRYRPLPYMTTPELLAIRWGGLVASQMDGNRSAYRPQLSGLLADGASDGRALHLALGVDNLSRVSARP